MVRRGDYILCNFPFREFHGPGPAPHIVLCATTGRLGGTRFAIVFYTTSRTDYLGARRPRQYLFVNQAKAIELGQKVAFHVDASRIARLPLTADYFPELHENTISVRGHDPEFVAKVEKRLAELISAGVEITRIDSVDPHSK